MTNAEKYKTAEERASAFISYCDGREAQEAHKRCLDGICIECFLQWLDLEFEEEKPLPCPFCGGGVDVISTSEINLVSCAKGCGYYSMGCESKELSIAAHNRVARAVMSAEKRRRRSNEDD